MPWSDGCMSTVQITGKRPFILQTLSRVWAEKEEVQWRCDYPISNFMFEARAKGRMSNSSSMQSVVYLYWDNSWTLCVFSSTTINTPHQQGWVRKILLSLFCFFLVSPRGERLLKWRYILCRAKICGGVMFIANQLKFRDIVWKHPQHAATPGIGRIARSGEMYTYLHWAHSLNGQTELESMEKEETQTIGLDLLTRLQHFIYSLLSSQAAAVTFIDLGWCPKASWLQTRLSILFPLSTFLPYLLSPLKIAINDKGNEEWRNRSNDLCYQSRDCEESRV